MGTLQVGGAERMLVDIVNKLDTNLYDITLLLNVNYGAFKNELRKDIHFKYLYEDLEYPIVSKHFPLVSKISKFLKNKIYLHSPWLVEKIVLENKEFDTTICFIQDLANSVYKIKSKKKIIWIHSVLSQMMIQAPYVKKHFSYFEKYDHIIAISDAVKTDIESNFPVLQNKIKVLLNPLNKEKITLKSNEKIPEEYGEIANKLMLVSVGRIAPEKGFLRLVELKKALEESNIECEIFIVGSPENKAYINEITKKSNELGIKLNLLGHRENPYPYIKNADIMVHPAIHEGYGLVLAESLLLGTPVIATNIEVFREFANQEIHYVANDNKLFITEAVDAIKKIINGERKAKIENTNIVDIKDYVEQLKSIL
jgi:glycosyltransferase involved in cell wall biosynthesis